MTPDPVIPDPVIPDPADSHHGRVDRCLDCGSNRASGYHDPDGPRWDHPFRTTPNISDIIAVLRRRLGSDAAVVAWIQTVRSWPSTGADPRIGTALSLFADGTPEPVYDLACTASADHDTDPTTHTDPAR